MMKDKIRKLLRESLLKELAMNVDSLPNGTVLIENGNTLTLYNTKFIKSDDPSKGVLAFVAMQHFNGFSEVALVAAHKGFGPLIYELAMQFVYPTPLMSARDGDTREGAIRIWKYFYDGNAPYVEVKTREPGDENYEECLEWGCADEHPEFFQVYNSQFYLSSIDEFQMLSEYGEEWLEKMKLTRDDLTKIGREFFEMKYSE